MKPKSDETVELHAYFSGRVQGVSFRATTRHYARELGIMGFVRNLEDGRVELLAQGSKKAVDRLLELLKGDNGPIRIDEVVLEYCVPDRVYADFS